jgi:hypothetical protein
VVREEVREELKLKKSPTPLIKSVLMGLYLSLLKKAFEKKNPWIVATKNQ